MIKLHLDEGLNDEQVQRNRKVYGDNCVAFSEIFPFKSRLISSVSHVFSIIMFALIAVTIVVALKLNENDQIGQKEFAMPVACTVAAFFIVFIGIEDGFKHKGFLILTIFSVVQLGCTVYEYILSGSDITLFYYHLGLYILILFAVTLNDIFRQRKIKCQFLLNKHFDKIDLNDIIEKNKEKAQAKKEKRGIRRDQLMQTATMNTKKSLSDKANLANVNDEVLSKAAEYRNNARQGSLASKANLVSDYNKKNNK